ncbi:MAG TPA: VWA domain-containing protein [Stenomitos sp.]
MAQPTMTLIPLRSVVASDQETTLDLLIKIEVPEAETETPRPPLNLGLVMDRSGSMSGDKLRFAKDAAAYLVGQLTRTDRVSVTIFDDDVEVVLPSMLADNPTGIQKVIAAIRTGGSTDLYEGWRQGSEQVKQFHDSNRLNRVILLSDGQANVGETNPDTIASKVHRLMEKGISTSTMGVGDDYNEDLLEAMARSGDGNYYYIQSPDELPSIFRVELQGLSALVGQRVSLGIRGLNGVLVADVLNDFDRTSTGNFKLPNLIHGGKVSLVVRLKVPPVTDVTELCSIRLAYDEPQATERHSEITKLELGSVPFGQLDEFPRNEEVERATALLMAARARKEAVRHLDHGNFAAARSTLNAARDVMACLPMSFEVHEEMSMLTDLEQDLDAGDVDRLRKKATFQSYQRRRGMDQ